MATQRIKAAVFDFFGTLVPSFGTAGYRAVLHEVACLIGIPPDIFVEKWITDFSKRMTGHYPTLESNAEGICRELRIVPDRDAISRAIPMVLDYQWKLMVPRPHVLEVLTELRHRKVRIGLTSDCSAELPALWNRTPFPPLFDAPVFSCVVGARKPDPAIYLEACRLLQVQPQECLYVGDGGSRELSGAAAVGMSPILFFDENEREGSDAHRVDEESWDGPSISDFRDLFGYVGDNPGTQDRRVEMNIGYYDTHGETFFEETASADLSHLYDPFLAQLPAGARILDAGCGTGRDTRVFLQMGYDVTAFDASEEMVKRARLLTGIDVRKSRFEEFASPRLYDGIWSCASLLHVPRSRLSDVMAHLAALLRPGGTWYLSFKHGSGDRERDGRFFTDLEECDLRSIVDKLPGMSVSSVWVAKDSRPGKNEEWLNGLLLKAQAGAPGGD
jgi:HAD superfamily hydrolase (TIGR01509 family)